VSALLSVSGLQAAYGASQVLFGVDLSVGAGEVVTLIGRNGMGKTTTIKSIMGLLRPKGGKIIFAEENLTGLPSHKIAKAGLGLVPEGRQIFPNLTVRENLVATAANRRGVEDPWSFDRVVTLFPSLGRRLDNMGNQLSGGEQQMLAVGRALMTNPRLLILDEATEGLAPLIRDEIWRCLAQLKAAGQSILVIDKNVAALARIADRHYILEKGHVVWSGSSTELTADVDLQRRFLGV
jgi:branched-chain amino acid transport system ATP-binding protein